MKMARERGLGDGIGALIHDNTSDSNITTLPLSQLERNKLQPRREFDQASLSELADSITQLGVIQPILVRPIPGGGYQIVAGERRFRAAQMAGLKEVPVIIREMDDRETDEVALVENLQREDLSPIEEALGYSRLMSEYSMTQEEVSRRVGKARSTIANSVRLLDLPEAVQQMLSNGDITTGHARPLLGLSDAEEITRIASLITARGLNVRDVERLVRKEKERKAEDAQEEKKETKPRQMTSRAKYIEELELAMRTELCRGITITETGKEKGTLTIEYNSYEELADMAMRLAGNK